MLTDIRYALRSLLRSPGLALVALGSLALGIGANTAIFSVVDAVVLHPLRGVLRPDNVVVLANDITSYPAYREFRDDAARAFQGLAAYAPRTLSLWTGDRSTLVHVQAVSANYFSVLGVGLALGRGFAAEENEPGAAPVAVVSHAFWLSSMGGVADPAGRTVRLNGRSFTVIGVAPAGFRGTELLSQPSLWVPIEAWKSVAGGDYAALDLSSPGWGWLRVLGRLAPGVSVAAAQAQLQASADRQAARFRSAPQDFHARLVPAAAAAAGQESGDAARRFAWLLMVVVALALLVACANLANLLLARAARRSREMGVRRALGASRGRLLRQLLTESGVLAVGGTLAGLVAAAWGLAVLGRFHLPGGASVAAIGVGLDSRVIGFGVVLGIATTLLFGLAPALRASLAAPGAGLGDRSVTGGRRAGRLRAGLIAAQVAVCLLLLVGAGVFLHSLRAAMDVDLGFEPRNLAGVAFDLRDEGYNAARAGAFATALLARVRALPYVVDAAWVALPPMVDDRERETFEIDGRQLPGKRPLVEVNAVGPGYFRTLGIPILRGHAAQDADIGNGGGVAVINRAMAERYWPGADPIGAVLRIRNLPFTVVGVARNVKHHTIAESPAPYVYVSPDPGFILNGATLVVRARGAPARALAAVTAQVAEVDPAVPVMASSTAMGVLAAGLAPQRLAGWLFGIFGALALVIAAGGLYGVVAYNLSQRIREIGVRIALGASPRSVTRLVVVEGVGATGVGLVLGLLAALGMVRAVRSFVLVIAPVDPIAFAGAAALLVSVVGVAAYLPARRATRIDPVEALRAE
jgi:putative ABC transport system permease protein